MKENVFILALFLFFLIIVIKFFVTILNLKFNLSLKFQFALYTVLLMIISYTYEPSIYSDLYRLFLTMDVMRTFNQSFYNDYEYITSMLFAISIKFEDNSVLPLIITSIRYSLFFTCLIIFKNKYKLTSQEMNLYLIIFFAYFPVIESISGIRYYFAVTIFFVFFISWNFFKKKKIYILGMITPIFIHVSSLMIIIVFLLSLIKRKVNFIIFNIILLTWMFWQEQIIIILNYFSNPFSIYLRNTLIIYLEDEREISINLTLARLIFLIIIFFLLYIMYIKKSMYIQRNLNYFKFITLYVSFCLGSLLNSVFFQRNIFVLAICIFPLIVFFYKDQSIRKYQKIFLFIMLLTMSFLMYLNQVYGVLYGYF